LAIKNSTGDLFLYAGDGKGGFKYPYPKVGYGWTGFDLYAAGDINGDGKADTLSIDGSGNLFFYAGKGDGTFARKIQVGNGWLGYRLAAGADLNGDGFADRSAWTLRVSCSSMPPRAAEHSLGRQILTLTGSTPWKPACPSTSLLSCNSCQEIRWIQSVVSDHRLVLAMSCCLPLSCLYLQPSDADWEPIGGSKARITQQSFAPNLVKPLDSSGNLGFSPPRLPAAAARRSRQGKVTDK